MHSVGLQDPGEERQIKVGQDKKYKSIQASAVTLSSGDVLVTGGIMGRQDEVYLFTDADQTRWTQKQSMNHPRSGHSSTRVVLERKEKVLVAGGWINGEQATASAEIYTLGQDNWMLLPAMPAARVDFTLKVMNKLNLNYFIS